MKLELLHITSVQCVNSLKATTKSNSGVCIEVRGGRCHHPVISEESHYMKS